MRTISITIPTYEMHGLGAKFLEESFVILQKQTYKDFDVVISDHSQNDEIENLCKKYSELLDIKYIRNTEKRGNSSANLNNAIKQATGKLIKILFQDDFLFDEKSLEKIVKNFDLEKDSWLVSACEHSKDGKNFIRPFYPKYNHKIHLGKNTISSPSVLTIKNDSPLLFDENLLWLMDCEYYRKCYDAFGDPKILKTITVVNRVGKHQITKTLATIKIRKQEKKYMIKKFGKKGGPLSLPKVTLVAVSSVKIKETIDALSKSMRRIKYAEVLFLTHEEITLNEKGIKVVKIPKLDYLEYSKFILYEIRKYVNSEFVLMPPN
jgi:glycosyltransferase involved in cell wall biosynthesis